MRVVCGHLADYGVSMRKPPVWLSARRRLLAATCAVFLVLPSTAWALDPMPVTGALPADGSSLVVATPGTVAFEIDVNGLLTQGSGAAIYLPGNFMEVEVSTQNVPGQDGTLADDLRLDYFLLNHSDS